MVDASEEFMLRFGFGYEEEEGVGERYLIIVDPQTSLEWYYPGEDAMKLAKAIFMEFGGTN